MGSYQLFQPLRPRHKQSTQNKLKRPASLELQMNLKRQLSKARHDLMTIRGNVSSTTIDKDSNGVKEHTIPTQIADTTPGPSQAVPGSTGPCMAPGTKESKEIQRDQSDDRWFEEEDSALGEVGDSRCSSPEESNIIDLDSLLDFGEISPVSDEVPRSASRLARFFPELSSHFSIVSPVCADRNPEREMGPTPFERELEERVQILYRGSADVDPEINEAGAATRSSFALNGFDGASSCYSRRTSITTIGTDFWGDDGRYPFKSPDAYSIQSPVAVGVFDDVPSLSSLRRLSDVSRYSLHSLNPIHHQWPTKQVAMNDLKNKPLPLEPVFNFSSASRRQSDSPLSPTSSYPRPQWLTPLKNDLMVSPLQLSPLMTHNEWKNSMLHQLDTQRQPGHVWHGSEHSQLQAQPCRSRHESELQTDGHRGRHVPTLSQAAEELEDTLAELADKDLSQKSRLVLDRPLQISRNNGDLIATRRAPLPPSTKLHFTNTTPSSTPKKESPNKNKHGRSYTIGSSPTKEPSRVKSDSKEKTQSRSHETWNERLPMLKSERSMPSEGPKKAKKKKSFLAPFRKSQVRTSARSEEITSEHVSDLRQQLPQLETDDLATAALLERVVEHFLSGSPGGPINQPVGHQAEVRKKMRQSWALISTAQASSLQLTDQIYELPAEPTSPSSVLLSSVLPLRTKSHDQNVTLPADMPVDLIITIMEKIDSLDDLFNFVLVNKKTYSAFKRRELPLIKNALFKMSPPAWELREMSPPWEMEWQLLLDPDSQVPEYTPTLYLQRYAQDIYTLAKLKALVLARCAPFLRPDTVRGLAGVDNQRAEEVDDAFWRLWTFCRIFGSGKRRENDITGQMDWLNGGVQAKKYSESSVTQPFGINNVLFEPPKGFGRGNLDGLSQKQMYDLTEIWTCMGVLLQPLHGKCIEARKVGIFDGLDVPDGDAVREETVLEEWTSYIMTLGLSAVLTLSSVCATDTPFAKLTKAHAIGLTKWQLTETEVSRSSFLKEAVSRAYELHERNSSPPNEPQSNPRLTEARESRTRQTAFANELRRRRARGLEEPEGRISFSAERPMSKYSAILRNLDRTPEQPAPPVPVLVVDRSSTSTAGEAPQTPTYASDSSTSVQMPPAPVAPVVPPVAAPVQAPVMVPVTVPRLAPLRPQVLDPVDLAIHMMVNDLGFATEDAKWALKITDTGEGIDAAAAVQLLQRQKKKNERNPFGKRDNLLSSVIRKQKSHDSGWRWA